MDTCNSSRLTESQHSSMERAKRNNLSDFRAKGESYGFIMTQLTVSFDLHARSIIHYTVCRQDQKSPPCSSNVCIFVATCTSNTYLPPSPRLKVQCPYICEELRISFPSTNDQLRMVSTIAQTRCCRLPSCYRPGVTFKSLQFAPVLHNNQDVRTTRQRTSIISKWHVW